MAAHEGVSAVAVRRLWGDVPEQPAVLMELLQLHAPAIAYDIHQPPVAALQVSEPCCRGCDTARDEATPAPTWPCRTVRAIARHLDADAALDGLLEVHAGRRPLPRERPIAAWDEAWSHLVEESEE